MSNCARCRYAGSPNALGNVECHRYPPVGKAIIFPLMRAIDWCGEWEQSASAQADADIARSIPCIHNCDEGGICLADGSSFQQSCPSRFATSQEAAAPSEEPAMFVSPGQFANRANFDSNYMPFRLIAEGLFTMPLFASPAVAPVAGSVKEATTAEEILLTVKKFIKAENEHTRKSGGEAQPTNTSRDEADHWHAQLVGFTVADCDAALKLVRRRLSSITPATKGGEDEALNILRMLLCVDFEHMTEHDDLLLESVLNDARAALSAQDTDGVAKPGDGVPGMVLVPREPSEAMMAAGYATMKEHCNIHWLYVAMVNAALSSASSTGKETP